MEKASSLRNGKERLGPGVASMARAGTAKPRRAADAKAMVNFCMRSSRKMQASLLHVQEQMRALDLGSHAFQNNCSERSKKVARGIDIRKCLNRKRHISDWERKSRERKCGKKRNCNGKNKRRCGAIVGFRVTVIVEQG